MKIFSAQLKGTTIVVSGSSASITGSFTGSIAGIDINETNQFTASTIARLNSIETISSSNDSRVNSLEAFSSSIFTTNTFTSSASARLNALEITSASVDTLNSNQNTRLNSLEDKTGSLATTGSNTFYGQQVFSGSLYVQDNLIVQGSSSLQNITASAVSIGTNIVYLNTDTPAVRFAGLTVQDSGSSAGVTGSMLWDSLCNRWIYSNPSTIGYSGGMLLSGPRTQTLGTEPTLTCNYIAKSGGGDHLYDSCIIDDGTTVCVNTTLKANGQVCGVMGNFSCFGIGTMTPVGKLDVTLVNTRRFIVTYDDSIITIKGASDTGAGENLRVIGDNLIFNTNSVGSGTERMRITSAGNIGIGATNPGAILPTGGGTIVTNGWGFSAAVCASRKIVEIDSNDNNGGNVGLFLRQPNNSTGLDIWSDSYYGNTYIDSRFDNSASYLTFRFRTNCSNNIVNAMAITAAGNVGIGTCTPTGILQVSSENSGNVQMLLVRNYATSATGNFTGCYTAEIRGTSNSNVRHAMLINNQENDSTRRVLDITSTFGTIASFVSNGNVGIGTSTPTRPLEIRTGGSNTTPAGIFFGAATQAIVSGEPQIVFSSNISPTLGTPTATELARGGMGFQYVSAAQPSEFSIGIQCTNVCNSNFKIWNNAARLTISSTGISTFSCQVCAPNIVTSGINASVRGGDGALFRGSNVTQVGNNITFDAFRFLNATGGVGGAASSMSGILYMSFSDTNTGGNQVSYQYLIITTGNGVSPGPYTFTQLYAGPVRGTNPISSISLVNDGEGGAVKVRATTAASGVGGANAYISFVGTAV